LTGTADLPDVPASPIAAVTSIANKIVRIVMSPPHSRLLAPVCVLPMPPPRVALAIEHLSIIAMSYCRRLPDQRRPAT